MPGYHPDSAGWFHEFRIEETAGVSITVHEHTTIIIIDNGGEGTHSSTGKQRTTWRDSDTLVLNRPQNLGGGFPLQNMNGVRPVMSGTDANGISLNDAIGFHESHNATRCYNATR